MTKGYCHHLDEEEIIHYEVKGDGYCPVCVREDKIIKLEREILALYRDNANLREQLLKHACPNEEACSL